MALPPFHPHWDVITVMLLLAGAYLYAVHRIEPSVAPTRPTGAGKQATYLAGVLTLWVATGWPIHDLAEEALFSLHMVQHILIQLVVPPLMLMGIPTWMGAQVLGNGLVRPWLAPIARPVAAYLISTAVLLFIHWPKVVELQVTSEFGHLLIHVLLFGSGVVMWLPIVSPTPAIPRARPPVQMLYLLAWSVLPLVPASFLTFSSVPLYPVYGDAALAYGVTAVTDQTIAGLIMKILGGFYLLGWIAVIWFRWAASERRWDEIERQLDLTR